MSINQVLAEGEILRVDFALMHDSKLTACFKCRKLPAMPVSTGHCQRLGDFLSVRRTAFVQAYFELIMAALAGFERRHKLRMAQDPAQRQGAPRAMVASSFDPGVTFGTR